MNFKNFVAEAVGNTRHTMVKITDGTYKGRKGTMVFSNLLGDVRYYVIELDEPVKGVDVVIVYNGEYDNV